MTKILGILNEKSIKLQSYRLIAFMLQIVSGLQFRNKQLHREKIIQFSFIFSM